MQRENFPQKDPEMRPLAGGKRHSLIKQGTKRQEITNKGNRHELTNMAISWVQIPSTVSVTRSLAFPRLPQLDYETILVARLQINRIPNK